MTLKQQEQLLFAAYGLRQIGEEQLSWLFLFTWAGMPALPGYND